MKIVVIGGSGLIGSKLVSKLREHGHETVAASPGTGVNTLTGEGLAGALADAAVVIDVSNSPSFEDAAALEFFERPPPAICSLPRRRQASATTWHCRWWGPTGCSRAATSGPKLPEKLIENSAIPYSIVHATQFFRVRAEHGGRGQRWRHGPVCAGALPAHRRGRCRPAAGRIALGSPLNGMVEVAGPEQFRMTEFFRSALAAREDARTVLTDPHASYFGAELGERTLLPGADAVLGETRYRNWPGRAASGK